MLRRQIRLPLILRSARDVVTRSSQTQPVRFRASFAIEPVDSVSTVSCTYTDAPAVKSSLKEPGLQLRPYQEECVQAVLTALQNGHRSVGVSMATGSGKTVIFTELIGRVPGLTKDATRTLILVHRRELVEQAARHCSNRYPNKTVDIEMGNLHASGYADITVASVQSINSKDRMEKFDPRQFKLVLVDEAHHIVASGYLKVLEHFGLQSDGEEQQQPSAIPALVGVSATFARFDGLALGKAIKHIVYHRDYIDMIGEKWLSDVIFTTVKSHANLSKVKKGASGDFLSSSLSKAVNTDEINLTTVRSWLTKAAGRRSTLVFCVDVAHVKSLTNTFREHGVDARYITGDTPNNIRGERLDAFRRREFSVLVNCSVFTEGTDIPNIDCVLLARPTKSRNLLVQMIGRGMRLFPDKQNCHIIDMVASLETGIVTTPTLFGLDPGEMVESAEPGELKDKKRRGMDSSDEDRSVPTGAIFQRDMSGKVTFTDYDSVSDLIDDTSAERYIRVLSAHAWVHVGNDRYVLVNGPNGSYLTLERAEGEPLPSNETPSVDSSGESGTGAARFQVRYTQRLLSSTIEPSPSLEGVKGKGGKSAAPFMRPRILARTLDFESAIHAADTFASKHFTRNLIANAAAARWRSADASEAQLAFLNRFRGQNGEEVEKLKVGDVSKGEATDMITKIKFGAKSRYQRLQKGKVAMEKKRQTSERQRRRETIVLGPLSSSPL